MWRAGAPHAQCAAGGCVYLFCHVLVAVGVPCARTARALGYCCAYTYYNDESRETEWSSTWSAESWYRHRTPRAGLGAKKRTQWEDRERLGWHEGRSLRELARECEVQFTKKIVASAVDRSVGAQEVACEPSGLHLPCVLAHGVQNTRSVAIPNCHSPFSRGGARARGGDGCAGCLWARERYAMSALGFFLNIEGQLTIILRGSPLKP